MLRCTVEEMRGALGKVDRIDPARTDQRKINVMLDHPLECPGLRTLSLRQTGVEIKTVAALDMGADEGGIGHRLAAIVDEWQLPLRGRRRHRAFLPVGQSRHLELHLGLGDEGADFREAEAGAKAVKRDHASSPEPTKVDGT